MRRLITLVTLITLPPLVQAQCVGPGVGTSTLPLCLPQCGSRNWCQDMNTNLTRLDILFQDNVGAGGHDHRGTDGHGPKIPPGSLSAINAPGNLKVPFYDSGSGLFSWGDASALGQVPATRQILTEAPELTGGGDLSTDRTIRFNYTGVPGLNPALNAGECVFASSGITCEGTDANDDEVMLQFSETQGSGDSMIRFPSLPSGPPWIVCLGGERCTKGTGDNNVVIGRNSATPSLINDSVWIGDNTTASSDACHVLIGEGATCSAPSPNSSAILIGPDTNDGGFNKPCIAIGAGASCPSSDLYAVATHGMLSLGSTTSPISNIYGPYGSTVTSSASPAAFAIVGTHLLNLPDRQGTDIIIQGGSGTGSARGSRILFYTPQTTTSGPFAQVPQLRWLIDGNGNLLPGSANAVSIGIVTDVGPTIYPVKDIYVGNSLDFRETAVGAVFEGSSNDAFETTLTAANPTADRTFTLPNVASGDVCISGVSCQATSGTSASAFFSSGFLPPERGGTGIDTSFENGEPYVEIGVWHVSYPIRWIPISVAQVEVDGTVCTKSARSPAGGAKVPVVNCGDDNAGAIYLTVFMPESWSGHPSPIRIHIRAENENAAPSGVLAFNASCQCNSTWSASWGASANLDTPTFTAQFKAEEATAIPSTPASCTRGDQLSCRLVVDAAATTTQVADTYLTAIRLGYEKTSFDDL